MADRLFYHAARKCWPNITPTQFEAAMTAIEKRNRDAKGNILTGVTISLLAQELEIELRKRLGPEKK